MVVEPTLECVVAAVKKTHEQALAAAKKIDDTHAREEAAAAAEISKLEKITSEYESSNFVPLMMSVGPAPNGKGFNPQFTPVLAPENCRYVFSGFKKEAPIPSVESYRIFSFQPEPGKYQYISDHIIQPGLKILKSRVKAVRDALDAMNRKAFEEARPELEAKLAEERRKELEAEQKRNEEQATLEKAASAERLKTGLWVMETPSYNKKRYGSFWCAKVTYSNGPKPNYAFGQSTGKWGKDGLLSISCLPGEIVAWGHKDYRNANGTEHYLLRMLDDGSMEQLSNTEAYRHWKATKGPVDQP